MAVAIIDQLAALREASGLTQVEVAARMGTSQPVVARLEAGGRDPRLSTLERYAQAVGAAVEVRRSLRSGEPSAAGLASRLRSRLADRSEPATATFREVVQFVDDMTGLPTGELRSAIGSQPVSTGDPRWDAVVAAAVDWVAARHEIAPPRWTRAKRWRLPEPGWVLTPHRRLHPLVRDQTPVEFARHGVFVDAASLASV